MPDNLQELIAEAERLRASAVVHPQNTRRWFKYHSHLNHTYWPLVAAYRATLAGMEASHAERDKLAAELATTKAIIATHDLCHDLHGTVGPNEFAAGCAAEQRKLYGCAPDADCVAMQEREIERLEAELATKKQDLDNERQVRAVQAGKLAEIQALCNKPEIWSWTICRQVLAIIERGGRS